MDRQYQIYKEALAGRVFPCAYVDLDLFDQNIQDVLARAHGRNICVASKSIRCRAMIERVQAASPTFHSLMAYSVREALYLASHGLDNLLVAYPVWSEARLPAFAQALREGKCITLMVDCPEHVDMLEVIGREAGVTISICIDLDLSSDFPGLHFGVMRSGIQTPAQALQLWELIRKSRHVRLDGLMGYEAQIAGLQDNAGSVVKNAVVRRLKKRSLRELRARRHAVVTALRNAGAELKFVNGGGTGSVETTLEEEVVTEVTVGSAFYSPTLFDGYNQFRHKPAAGFAVEIVRQPKDTIYTCHGGGYIASGPAGTDRLPSPYLPSGAKLLPLEGAGEVQTPVQYAGKETLTLGDPIFFRHTKAGELCERFNTLLLIQQGRVVEEVPTYRGEGQCFL